MNVQQMIFILSDAEGKDIDLCVVMQSYPEERLKAWLLNLHIEADHGCSDNMDFEYDTDFIADGKFPTLKVIVKSNYWNDPVIRVADELARTNTGVTLLKREVAAYYLSEMDNINIPNPLRFEERLITIG